MPSSENSPKRIAVVVNALTGDELKAGNSDTSRVYTLLRDRHLGKCSNESPKPLHECKSRSEFWTFISPILEGWCINDQLIFYFSGHGSIRRNGIYCLQLGQTSSDFLPFDNLMGDLYASGVQRAIIILDACHSGAVVGIKDSSDVFSTINGEKIPKGIAVIASSRASQVSHELPDGSASVFTELLYNGIDTGLEGQPTLDGLITVGDIVTYISQKLESDKEYAAYHQRPVFKVNEADRDIWIAKNKSGKTSTQEFKAEKKSVRTREELELLYEKTVKGELPCPKASLEDLDWSLVEAYAEKLRIDPKQIGNRETILSRLKLFSSILGKPTLHKSAVLCFAKHPETIYSQAKSIFVVGNSGDETFERYDVTGPLSSQVGELIRKTEQYLSKISLISESGKRIESSEIDMSIIRELISNAIAHRDYESTSVVKVIVTSDAVEIQSPGTFPKSLSWENFLKNSNSPVSIPVNGAISQYLTNLLVFEGIGRGFNVIHNYIKENGEESIEFEELLGPITSVRVLRRKSIASKLAQTNFYNGVMPQRVPRQLPALDAHFVNRKYELTELLKELQPGKVVTLCGPGGIGKSALAARAVHQLEPERFPDGIFFYTFYGQPDPNLALEQIALTFGVEPTSNPTNAAQRALAGKRALLLLDNTEDADNLEAVLQVRGECGVLITSRSKGDALDIRLDLTSLNDGDAIELLQRWTQQSSHELDLRHICQLVGGLPLALRQIGHYLEKTGESAAEYLEWLKQQPFEALEHGERRIESVKGLLDRSCEQVSEPARQALSVVGLLAFSPFTIEPVAAALNSDARSCRITLGELTNYGLLLREDIRYSVSHALMHTYAQQQLTAPDDILERLAEYYTDFAKEQSDQGRAGYIRMDQERPHILHLLDRYQEKEAWKLIGPLVEAVDSYFDRQGYWAEWQTALAIHLNAAQQLENRQDEAWCLNGLGLTFSRQGQYVEALTYFEQSRAIQEELGLDMELAISLNNIGAVYDAQGQYVEALTYFEQSRTIQERMGQEEDVATSLNNIGLVYQSQGQYAEALTYFEQSREIRERLGLNVDLATSLNNIGAVYRLQGQYAEALTYYEQSREIRERLGLDVDLATSLNNIGAVYDAQRQYAEALTYFEQSRTIQERLGLEVDLARSLNNIGSVYDSQGQYAEALTYFEQSRTIQERLGLEVDLATTYWNIGLLYESQGNLEQAEHYINRTVQIEEKIGHPETKQARVELERIRQQMKK